MKDMKVVMFSVENKPYEIQFKAILEEEGKLESNYSISQRGKDKNGKTRFKWNFNKEDKEHTPTLEFVSTLNNLRESSI